MQCNVQDSVKSILERQKRQAPSFQDRSDSETSEQSASRGQEKPKQKERARKRRRQERRHPAVLRCSTARLPAAALDQRSRPAAWPDAQRQRWIDRAATAAHLVPVPRKRSPRSKCAMIGALPASSMPPTRRVPCRHASGSAHAGAAPTVSPAASTVACRPPRPVNSMSRRVASPCARCPAWRWSTAPPPPSGRPQKNCALGLSYHSPTRTNQPMFSWCINH